MLLHPSCLVQGARRSRRKDRGRSPRKKLTTTYEIYSTLVGEIGIPRNVLLNDLWYWEIKAIIAGYRKRDQQAWERTRWQTFMLMHNGMVDLSKAGITSPLDLLRFPWDTEGDDDSPASDMPTKEEIEQLRKELNEHNARLAASSAPAPASASPASPL